ncbi:SDR family NAD(P)-dependent oxidoreductase [Bittarella massiliensis (ex Durand et al. 2017)]|uniref:SDR family NAD(P)-dependent oxidoreductase n=1 Tax=Bittarella massiliensis (ex Durand et al. 2017) TaxID=1720313 RepID=UPI000946C7D5|nr:SDR family NAD(P)-dependent oxidoreductase [Bittarella massiliensis (ex Durand et al. 2017)]
MGRTALITGGSRGIGAACARAFAAAGWKVAINYCHSRGAAEALAGELAAAVASGRDVVGRARTGMKASGRKGGALPPAPLYWSAAQSP